MDGFPFIGAVLIAVVALCLGWRLLSLRSKGMPVLVREMPAKGDHGWRHGCLRYNENSIRYYKLRSITPRPDGTFGRGVLRIESHRELTDSEKSFIDPHYRVLTVSAGEKTFEIACSTRAEITLTSWLESAPNDRLIRPKAADALKELERSRRRQQTR